MSQDIDEVLRNMGGSPISNLYTKMERAIRNQQGTRFSANDIDWFIIIGGYAMLLQAVADEAFTDSAARLAARGHDVSRFPRPAIQTFKGKPEAADEGGEKAAEPKTAAKKTVRRTRS